MGHFSLLKLLCPSDDATSQLKRAEDYRILSASDCITLEGVDDATQFEAVQAACRTIGMTEETQLQVRDCHIYFVVFFLTVRRCFLVPKGVYKR